MKKSLLAICALTSLLSIGCTEQEEPQAEIQQAEVEFTLDYSFVESGSLTRAGSDAYTDFYNKYVKTKVLTPRNYSLTFTNKETGAVATVKGEWDKNHALKLPTGEYEVVGTSYPNSGQSGSFQGIDSLYLCFDEIVNINTNTTSLNLTAQYDSYLLMFDKSDKELINYHRQPDRIYDGRDSELKEVDGIYYALMNEIWVGAYNVRLTIQRPVGNSSINMNDILFEKGKYYYFNDLSNSFDIPPMESGN